MEFNAYIEEMKDILDGATSNFNEIERIKAVADSFDGREHELSRQLYLGRFKWLQWLFKDDPLRLDFAERLYNATKARKHRVALPILPNAKDGSINQSLNEIATHWRDNNDAFADRGAWITLYVRAAAQYDEPMKALRAFYFNEGNRLVEGIRVLERAPADLDLWATLWRNKEKELFADQVANYCARLDYKPEYFLSHLAHTYRLWIDRSFDSEVERRMKGVAA